MTPLSDTHARARKLKDVIDKRVRARVSKQIALPVPMSRKVFSVSFFLTFSHSCFGDVFDHFWYQNGDQNAPKWHPKTSLFRDLFFTRSRYQKYIILGPSDPQIHASRAGEVHFHTFSLFSYFSQKCEFFVSKMTSFWHTWTA